MIENLEQLAQVNLSGSPFLFAYGVTWIICGILWKKVKESYASLATLFQGMIALPAALFLMNFIGAFENRPAVAELNSLTIIIAMSQLLVLPLLIAMFTKKHFTLIPFVFSVAAAIHFLMYTWLYQTYAYTIMAVSIAVALAIIYGKGGEETEITTTSAAQACLSTGVILLLTASYFILTT